MKILRSILIIVLFLSIKIQSFAQHENIILKFNEKEKPLIELFSELESNNDINFYFKKEWVNKIIVKDTYKNKSLKDLLNDLQINNALFYTIDDQGDVILSKQKFKLKVQRENYSYYANSDLNNDNQNKTNNSSNISTVLEKVVIGKKNGSNKKYSIVVGSIKDMDTGEPLLGASVFVEELKTGAVADVNGNYMLTLKQGSYTLTFNSVGKTPVQKRVTVHSDGRLNIDLKKSLIAIDEVVVKEDKYNNTKGMQIGFEQITMKNIKELPPISGERDILKASLLLPGVQSVGESAAGYNIRGGEVDQNLFLINDVPVFNTSHMFGFFSAFNSEVIRNFNLFKSNIPVEYGGRISSVFDIQTKQGNSKKFSLKGGISPITAKLSAEGPIIKDKLTYIVGARSTYSNWILKRIENKDIRNSEVGFYDFIGNINASINDNNKISAFVYYSMDNYRMPTNKTFNYYNLGGALNWQHFFGKRLFSNLSFIYSNYHLKVEDEEIANIANVLNHDIKHYEIKHRFSYNPLPNHEIKFGYNSILYQITPGSYEPLNESSAFEPFKIEEESAIESAVYIGDKYDINPNLGIEGGIRYSFYNYLGPKTVYQYSQNEIPSISSLRDTSHFSNYDIVKTYSNLDVRLSARYLINSNNSIKAGYTQVTQYLYMLTNTISISPTDKWKLCDTYNKPIKGEQFNLGYYKNFEKQIEASVELYYKKTKNMVQFRNGAIVEKNEFLERDLIDGIGRAYGVELMLKKSYGKINGWINYTYSKSELQFDGRTISESINNGAYFPANADKPHNINLTTNIKSNRRLSTSINFTYSTGRPSTFPVSKYSVGKISSINYSDRNMTRLPDYWRVDLAFNLEGNLIRKKVAHAFWTLSIYNLTGRKNAYSVYFTQENGKVKGHKVSIFARPVITLSYNFKLGNYASE